MADRDCRPYTVAAVADLLAVTLEQAHAARGRASLAVSGGRSPGPIITALAVRLDPTITADLDLFWVDERSVPRDDPRRNDAAILAAWSGAGPLPQCHPLPAEWDDLAAAATAYGSELAGATGGRGLDAVLLGFGEDGHVASLFPGHPGLYAGGDVIVIRNAPKPPSDRLSLGLGTINRAGLITIIAPDQAKSNLLRDWLAAGTPVPCLLTDPRTTVLFLS